MFYATANPLLFPEFQCKLAGVLVGKNYGPDKLCAIFSQDIELTSTLRNAKEKTDNLQKLSAILINCWVINQRSAHSRPSIQDLVRLFRKEPIKREIETFVQ